MKIKYILPKEIQTRIDKIDKKLAKIEIAYAERIAETTFIGQQENLRNDFVNNQTVQMLQRAKCDIYEKSVERIEIELETEQEIKMFKDNWGVKELA